MTTLLKNIFELNGLTQTEVAHQTGVAQDRLSQLMNGKAKPSKSESEKLTKWFETDINHLLSQIKCFSCHGPYLFNIWLNFLSYCFRKQLRI